MNNISVFLLTKLASLWNATFIICLKVHNKNYYINAICREFHIRIIATKILHVARLELNSRRVIDEKRV